MPATSTSPTTSEPRRPERRGTGGTRRPARPVREGREGREEGLESGTELSEKVVYVNRTAKVVKGGRRFHFSALVVVGDGQGKVGYGLGKANEVADAIRKATDAARRSMTRVPMVNSTIPHAVESEYAGAHVLLRPASPGTGVIAGGGVRAVVEAAGIRDLLSKSLGSSNPVNVVKATVQALLNLRVRDEILEIRGIQKSS